MAAQRAEIELLSQQLSILQVELQDAKESAETVPKQTTKEDAKTQSKDGSSGTALAKTSKFTKRLSATFIAHLPGPGQCQKASKNSDTL